MYLVTTPQRPGRLRGLRTFLQDCVQRTIQRLPGTPRSDLELLLTSAGSVNELDYLERRWARTHGRRFG